MSTKRILSLVLALVMVLGTFGTVFAAEPTGNTKVDWLVEQGYVLGDAGGLRLEDGITRAEVSVIVAKALGLEAEAAAMANIPSKFSDMRTAGYAWANGFVNVLNANGYISGYPDGTFGPAKDITYAEVASMLVRVMGGLTEAEAKTAVWPTTYLAKAASLGIFEGVAGVDYSTKAVRGKIFEMVYNTLDKEVGNNTVIKAIVLENNRVESIDKNEVVVEILKVEQVANYAKESRVEKGQQPSYIIDAKLGDVENLLGQVANFTINKDGKVIKITPDTSYKVVSGPATATRNKINVDGTNYTVELDERYKDSDERIFRTYHNDKAYAYRDFFVNPLTKEVEDKFEVDYARVTVKNGKVLLIDAYSFEDVAPVQEVKKDGAEVYVYNDYRDARIEKYVPARVVSYTEKDGLRVSDKAEIKVNDVVHVYTVGTKKNVIVRQDAKVEGTYEKVQENVNGFFAYVDGKGSYIGNSNYRKPVYSYNSKEFLTLEAKNASSALWDFRNEKVMILIDINSDLQYIGATIDYNEGFLIIDEILSRGNVRFVQPNNETLVLEETFDSYFGIAGSTTNQRLSLFNRGDLSFVINEEGNIDTMERVRTAEQIRTGAALVDKDSVTKFVINSDLIKVNGTRYNVLPRTNVYRMSFDSANKVTGIVGTTLEAVRSGATLNSDLKAFVLTDAQVDALNLGNRVTTSTRSDVAHTIIFTNYTGTASYDYETIQVTAKDTNPRVIIGKDVHGTVIERTIDKNVSAAVEEFNNTKIGDIVRLSLTKDDAKIVKAITSKIKVDAPTFTVKEISSSTGYRKLVLVDKYGTINPNELWISNNALEFGTIATDLVVQYSTNTFGDVDVLRVYPRSKDVTGVFGTAPVSTAGVVTYINADGSRIEVDGVVYTVNDDTKLYNAAGTLVAAGKADVRTALLPANTVKVTKIVHRDRVIERFELVAAPVTNVTTLTVVDADVVTLLNNTAKTMTVEYNKTVAELIAAIAPTDTAATYKVLTAAGGVEVASTVKVATGMVVEVTAANGTTKANYAVTVKTGTQTGLTITDLNVASISGTVITLKKSGLTANELLAVIKLNDSKATVKVLTATAATTEVAGTAALAAGNVVSVKPQTGLAAEYTLAFPALSNVVTLEEVDANLATISSTVVTYKDLTGKKVSDMLALVKTTHANATAVVMFGGSEVAASASFAYGMTIKVTAEDGTATQTYTIVNTIAQTEVNNVAAGIVDFAVTGVAGDAIALPTVSAGYTVALTNSATTTAVTADSKIGTTTGTSNVEYTVTHTASGYTATKTVVVSVTVE